MLPRKYKAIVRKNKLVNNIFYGGNFNFFIKVDKFENKTMFIISSRET